LPIFLLWAKSNFSLQSLKRVLLILVFV
jgi:hypothetical protein